MPIYEYQCHECQQIFEEWQTDFEDKELECPVCGGKATKVISNSTFVLKGGGWYSSGYCKTDQASGRSSSSEHSSCSGAADSSATKPPVKEAASSTKESGGATT